MQGLTVEFAETEVVARERLERGLGEVNGERADAGRALVGDSGNRRGTGVEVDQPHLLATVLAAIVDGGVEGNDEVGILVDGTASTSSVVLVEVGSPGRKREHR